VIIEPVDDVPTACDSEASGFEDTPCRRNVAAVDVDTDAAISGSRCVISRQRHVMVNPQRH
jgi:hypothetical protein